MCEQRNLYTKVCRNKKSEYNRKESQTLEEQSRKNPNEFWKRLKYNKKEKSGLPDLDFYTHFKGLAKRDSNVSDSVREDSIRDDFSEVGHSNEDLDREITIGELDLAIKGLKGNKAAGMDNVLNEFIINSSQDIKCLMLLLFNRILSLEYFPSCWAAGEVVPIFKSGDKYNVNNYRGITLLSCLGKLFTRVLNNRLAEWAENDNILNDNQFGFRKGRSTTDCLFILHGLVEIFLSQKKELFCAFIDFFLCFY